jgi:hypothetical protein
MLVRSSRSAPLWFPPDALRLHSLSYAGHLLLETIVPPIYSSLHPDHVDGLHSAAKNQAAGLPPCRKIYQQQYGDIARGGLDQQIGAVHRHVPALAAILATSTSPPLGAEQEQITVRTPALALASSEPPGTLTGNAVRLLLNGSKGEGYNQSGSSSNSLASHKAAVSKPAVNQP